MPFFSVIIPLYNKELYIKSAIESVLNQTFKDYEIVIVNDGSTDYSLQIVNSFKNKNITVINQANTGVATARNNAIAAAKGKYISLLDADDTWYSNHLEAQKKLIDTFPNAKLYCNNYEIYYRKFVKRNAVFNFNYNKDCILVKDFFKANIINSVAWTSAVSFSKAAFNSIGGFNPKLETYEDIDLWIRFALVGTVAFNPKITMCYKLYVDGSLTKTENNNLREAFINSFIEEEKNNLSLKQYLDINRYALAIRCKIEKEHEIYKRTVAQITAKNLSLKQKFLIKMPRYIILGFKQFQQFLIKNNIYLSAFK